MTRQELVIHRQQMILAFLTKNGKATSVEIADALGFARATTTTYLRALKADSAIAYTTKMRGKVTMYYYTARMKVDIPFERQLPRPTSTTGHIVHRGTERDRPNPSARGQGAVSRGWGYRPSR